MKEICLGCTKETGVNEQNMKAETPFIGTTWKTRPQLLDRCPPEPGEEVPALMSQELGGRHVKSRDDVFLRNT